MHVLWLLLHEVLDYWMQRDSMRLLNGLWTQIDDRSKLGQVMRLGIVISAKRDKLETIKHLILEVNYLALAKIS